MPHPASSSPLHRCALTAEASGTTAACRRWRTRRARLASTSERTPQAARCIGYPMRGGPQQQQQHPPSRPPPSALNTYQQPSPASPARAPFALFLSSLCEPRRKQCSSSCQSSAAGPERSRHGGRGQPSDGCRRGACGICTADVNKPRGAGAAKHMGGLGTARRSIAGLMRCPQAAGCSRVQLPWGRQARADLLPWNTRTAGAVYQRACLQGICYLHRLPSFRSLFAAALPDPWLQTASQLPKRPHPCCSPRPRALFSDSSRRRSSFAH